MEIKTIELTQMPAVSKSNQANGKEDAREKPPTTAEIESWLVSYLAELLVIEADEVDVTIAFERYGLGSLAAIGLTGDLEEWLGYELDPTLLDAYPTIKEIALHLTEESKVKE